MFMHHDAISHINDKVQRQGELQLTLITLIQAMEEGAEHRIGPIADPPAYYVFTPAGKPVYAANANRDGAEIGGIVQALLAHMTRYIKRSPDSTQSPSAFSKFKAGKTLFITMAEEPLVYLVVDKNGFSEQQLRRNLCLIKNQIISTITQPQLTKLLRDRPTLDLRQTLGDNEPLLNSLVTKMDKNIPESWLSLESFPMLQAARLKIHQILLSTRCPSLLYGLILVDRRLAAVIRPQRHSLKPLDMQLVVNLVFNSNTFKDGEHWVPICLPEFNNQGFLYTFISFIAPKVAIVLLSPEKASFFKIQDMSHKIFEELEAKDLTRQLSDSMSSQNVLPADIGCPLIDHFLFKSHRQLQFVQSGHPDRSDESEVLSTYYRYKIHQARSQKLGIPLLYSRDTDLQLASFSWETPSFEIFCTLRANVTKRSLNESVNTIVSWVRKNESHLFVLDGAVF